MPQKRNKKSKFFLKGSIVVFALMIMFILSITTIGIITTAAIERRVSISTSNATGAFQVAESGMERTLQYFKSNFDKTLNDINGSGNCDSLGRVAYSSQNTVRFRYAAGGYIGDCAEFISNAKVIKSIGTTKRETQAMEEDVFLGATKLLLHFDGVDANHIQDSSYYYYKNTGMILQGNAELDYEEKQFGEASAKFDGDGDYVSIPYITDSDDLNFGEEDFTIDFWVRFNVLPALSSAAVIFSQYKNDPHMVSLSLLNNGGEYQWSFDEKDGVGNETNILASASSPAITTDTWYHVAYIRKGDKLKIFQDGSFLETGDLSGAMPNLDEDVSIGWIDDGGTSYLNGYLDELRISKGVARWWEEDDDEFDVPTVEYWPD